MQRPLPQQNYKNLTRLGKITIPFGGQTKYEQFHPGVDIANVKGTPIRTPVSGTVIDAVGGKVQGDADFGNSITILDSKGNKHQLNHLAGINVRRGDRVTKGQTQVGQMGNSGSAYSPSGQGDGTHLDYRLVSAYGRYQNPMTYIKNL